MDENTLSAPTAKQPLVGVGQMSFLISPIIIHVPALTMSAGELVNMPTSHKVALTAHKLRKLQHSLEVINIIDSESSEAPAAMLALKIKSKLHFFIVCGLF